MNTYYEISKALEETAKVIQSLPGSMWQRAEDDVQLHFNSMKKTVEAAQNFSQKCLKELTELDKKHAEECDRICKAVDARNKVLREAMNQIEYRDLIRVEELCKALQALRSINPEDLEILMKVLGGKS